MKLLLWVVLLLLFLWIFFPMGPKARFKKYEIMVHPYSGLDPVSWQRFLDSLHVFEQSASGQIDVATSALYTAIESIRDLALGNRRSDDGQYQDELNLIATNLGLEGELILNQNAISQGLHFFPRYLNNTFDDYVVNVGDPGHAKNHGQ
jgi:hypothetical protein